jgi:parallel beta-helix repeat protein
LADFTCGDPIIYQANSNKYYRDIAQNNIISNNKINYNKFGIRVQDNGTIMTNNIFIGTKSGPDIWVYSRVRENINDPIKNTTIRDNTFEQT